MATRGWPKTGTEALVANAIFETMCTCPSRALGYCDSDCAANELGAKAARHVIRVLRDAGLLGTGGDRRKAGQ